MSEIKKIVAANRFPRDPKTQKFNLGGLATALGSGQNMSWVGASDISNVEPTLVKGIKCIPAVIDKFTYKAHYEGAANSFLWPAFHGLKTPKLLPGWKQSYVAANISFVNAIEQEIQNTQADLNMVWVHDYHLFLVPGFLRERKNDASIGFFLHIPFPSLSEVLELLNDGRITRAFLIELLEGILGSDLIGFHIKNYSDNFIQTINYLGIEGFENFNGKYSFKGKPVKISEFPIGIDPERYRKAVTNLANSNKHDEIRSRFDPTKKKTVFVGVDRLDYTKGIDHKLLGFQQLLREGHVTADEVVMVQIAPTNRENVEAYINHKKTVDKLVAEIHAEFGKDVLHFVDQGIPIDEGNTQDLEWPYSELSVVELLSIADVAVVTAVKDGMNLVAKEFVAAQWFQFQQGIKSTVGSLVLSDGVGAIDELGAYSNSHKAGDIDDIAAKLLISFWEDNERFDSKRLSRIESMAELVTKKNTVSHWRDSFWSQLASMKHN